MGGRRALITGISGQDGSYLAELLLSKGYEVHGIVRRTSTTTRSRIEALHMRAEMETDRLQLHYGDMCDSTSLFEVVEKVRPHEVYNLAAQSQVRISFDMPEFTFDVTGLGAFRLLEAVRRAAPSARFYQAGSSEMFGNSAQVPQSEDTPFHPCSPYAIAKVEAHHTAVHYREAHGLFVCNGILFNHESPRRGENFLTRKVAIAAARIAKGLDRQIKLGTLTARRDWGFAPEYVEAMWLMLQQPEPGDFVIATGESHSVEEFVSSAFGMVGLDWREHVAYDDDYTRPTEVNVLEGNAEEARIHLGWKARTRFNDLIELMVEAELRRLAVCV